MAGGAGPRPRGIRTFGRQIDDAAGNQLPTPPKLAPSGRAGVRALKRPWSVRAAGGADTMRLRPNLCTGTVRLCPKARPSGPARAIIGPSAALRKVFFTGLGARRVPIKV